MTTRYGDPLVHELFKDVFREWLTYLWETASGYQRRSPSDKVQERWRAFTEAFAAGCIDLVQVGDQYVAADPLSRNELLAATGSDHFPLSAYDAVLRQVSEHGFGLATTEDEEG